jgi:hypothetical protein
MRGFLRKLLWLLFWPLRAFGYAADAYHLWTLREWILSAGGTAFSAGLLWAAAAVAQLPRLAIALVVVGTLLLAFWALIVLAEKWRVRRVAATEQPANQSPIQRPNAAIHEYIHNAYFGQPSTEVPLDERRRRIQKWRAEIHNGNFNRTPYGTLEFVETETYAEMSPYLPRKIRERFEGGWLLRPISGTPPHEQGAEGDKRVLLREVARIEKEWGLP